MGRSPLIYVHGNHDTGYDRHPPQGCDCIDDCLISYNAIRILGLGGCRRYHPGAHQYSEKEMRRRIRKLRFALWRSKGEDIVETHAPPHGLGDDNDPAHWGFETLIELLDKYQPQYLLHGHVHSNYNLERSRIHTRGASTVINTYERYVLELPDREVPQRKKNTLIWLHGKPKYKEVEL